MAGTNEMGSVEGQLVGLPLAGPETFSVQQLAYLKRALGLDETVLWEDPTGTSAATSCTLSESIKNFEKVKYYFINNDTEIVCREILTAYSTNSVSPFSGTTSPENGKSYFKNTTYNIDNATVTLKGGMNYTIGGNSIASYQTTNVWYLLKIVGIHRIAGGN